MVSLADNQLGVARAMERAGAGIDCGWAKNLTGEWLAKEVCKVCKDEAHRVSMSRAGQRLVDGHGARRVVERVTMFPYSFRPVESADCEMIFDWANDPDVRKASFQQEIIDWQQHQQWFCNKLEDAHCLFWIIMAEGDKPVGQVRFDIAAEEAVVSISLSKEARNMGKGSTVIKLSCGKFLQKRKQQRVKAFIKKDNSRSIKSFDRAGFKVMSELKMHGQSAVMMGFEGS